MLALRIKVATHSSCWRACLTHSFVCSLARRHAFTHSATPLPTHSHIHTAAHLQPECPHFVFVLDIVITLHGISILRFTQGRVADDNWMTHFTPDVCNINDFSGKALFYLEVIRTSPKTLGVFMSGHDVVRFVAMATRPRYWNTETSAALCEQMIVTTGKEIGYFVKELFHITSTLLKNAFKFQAGFTVYKLILKTL